MIVENIKEKDDIINLAKKVISASTLDVNEEGFGIKVSCSIGISIYPKDASGLEELIHHADVAMYIAKNSATYGDYYFYQESDF